jgi:hypothetical protein
MCGIRKNNVGLGQDKGKISPGWRSGKIRVGLGLGRGEEVGLGMG